MSDVLARGGDLSLTTMLEPVYSQHTWRESGLVCAGALRTAPDRSATRGKADT